MHQVLKFLNIKLQNCGSTRPILAIFFFDVNTSSKFTANILMLPGLVEDLTSRLPLWWEGLIITSRNRVNYNYNQMIIIIIHNIIIINQITRLIILSQCHYSAWLTSRLWPDTPKYFCLEIKTFNHTPDAHYNYIWSSKPQTIWKIYIFYMIYTFCGINLIIFLNCQFCIISCFCWCKLRSKMYLVLIFGLLQEIRSLFKSWNISPLFNQFGRFLCIFLSTFYICYYYCYHPNPMLLKTFPLSPREHFWKIISFRILYFKFLAQKL